VKGNKTTDREVISTTVTAMANNVIVIGAGLAGLATSIGLARLGGFHVDLVEKRSSFEIRGSTFGLAPNGAKALRELCPNVLEELLENGILMPTGGHMIVWWLIREALLREAEKMPDRINIRMGWNLQRIENDQESVRAYFDKDNYCDAGGIGSSSSNNQECLEGSILIAADGIHSAVRNLLGLPPADKPPSSLIWRGVAQVPMSNDSILYPYLTKGIVPLGSLNFGPSVMGVFSFHEKRPGVMTWTVASKALNIEEGTHVLKVLEPYFEDEQQEELIREIFKLSEEADLVSVYKNTVVRLPNDDDNDGSGWGGQGRIVLIGDAAHALRPSTGQGGSMAFEDAQLLCRKLKELDASSSLSSYESICHTLRSFENERLPRVRKIWQTEWDIAESRYSKAVQPSLDSDYREWVFRGI
jgi:FAD-dependent urate hydroxylase